MSVTKTPTWLSVSPNDIRGSWIPACAGMTRSGFRVFPGELRRRCFLLFVLPVEARVASPRALQLVLHFELEPPELLRFDLDRVAILERRQPAMVGAGREDVAGIDGVDRRHPFDTARDLVRHVVGVEVLFE